MSWDNNIFGQSKRIHIVLIVLLFTFVMGGFKYVHWPIHPKLVMRVLSVLLLAFYIGGNRQSPNLHFQKTVLLLAFYPFLSVIYSFIEYGQPIMDGIRGTIPWLLWLSYFFFHHVKISEGSFLKAILYIAFFIASVQIIQQFTYPDILFNVPVEDESNPDDELVSSRNGIWRFRLGDVGYFAALILFFLWDKVKQHISSKSIVFLSVMAVSLYLTLTRQIIFSAMLTIISSYLMGRKKLGKWGLALIITVLAIISYNYDALFGELGKLTAEETNEDYIRILSGQYFLTETFSSVKATILGHGVAVSGAFSEMVKDLQENWHFYASDVGFIGQMWKFGVPYVIICFYLFFSLFFTWRHYIPTYIRLFVLFTTIMSIMIFPMGLGFQFILWSFLLYICDMNIIMKQK